MPDAADKLQFDRSMFKTNIEEEVLFANMESATRRQLPQAQPWETQDRPIILLAGGPSLANFEAEIIERRKNGEPVVTVNGTHDWLLDRGCKPSMHLMLDGRPMNTKFVQRPVPECKYYIASQCHPEVFDALEGYDVTLWHGLFSDCEEKRMLEKYYFGQWFPIIGGCTVVLRGIMLLRLLGFENIELYGFDSCLMRDDTNDSWHHHAYKQTENDKNEIISIKVEGKEFLCATWMYSQALDFIEMSKSVAQHVNLIVHGDGLISYIIRTGCKKLEKFNSD